MRIMTPFEINFLLHCYARVDVFPQKDALVMSDTVTKFIADGLIIATTPEMWSTTERGRAHVEQLCMLPFPRLEWIGFDGSKISV